MPTLALAGDTMLGRGVGARLRRAPAGALFGTDLLDLLSAADCIVVNLECCISERGEPWPGRVFHFRAPPAAVDALHLLGVDCVTLANNHALDHGGQGLLDTLGHLGNAGIAVAGAGRSVPEARAPAGLDLGGVPLAVVAVSDHPAAYAATAERPGIAFADLHAGVPRWLSEQVGSLRAGGGAVLVSPHWGPNMTPSPVPHVLAAAGALVDAGATLVAGTSAHVFHGVAGRVMFDLGDFIDDYAADPVLRNDLGLLWLVTFEGAVPRRLVAVPLKLDHCRTVLASAEDATWVAGRFLAACRDLGTDARVERGRLAVDL